MHSVLRLAAMLVVLVGCSHPAEFRNSSLRLASPESSVPVEQQVVRRQSALAATNASIGDTPLEFDGVDQALSERFLRTITGRYTNDLLNVYGEDLSPADAEFLVIASRSSGYVGLVVRVRSVTSDGAYVDLQGLIYTFERNGRLTGVRGSHY